MVFLSPSFGFVITWFVIIFALIFRDIHSLPLITNPIPIFIFYGVVIITSKVMQRFFIKKKRQIEVAAGLIIVLALIVVSLFLRPVHIAVCVFLAGFGGLLNKLVIIANDFKMPAINNSFIADLISSQNNYCSIDENTRLKYLADTFFIKWPFVNAISVGDMLVTLGMYTLAVGMLFY